jgi:hypothetical protein
LRDEYDAWLEKIAFRYDELIVQLDDVSAKCFRKPFSASHSADFDPSINRFLSTYYLHNFRDYNIQKESPLHLSIHLCLCGGDEPSILVEIAKAIIDV